VRHRTEDAKFGSPVAGDQEQIWSLSALPYKQISNPRLSLFGRKDARRETGPMWRGRAGLEDRHGKT
jgi:hypothetical protein